MGEVRNPTGGCFCGGITPTYSTKNEGGGGYCYKKYHSPKSPKRWKRLVLDFNSEVQNRKNIPHRYKKLGTPYRVCCALCKGITSPYLVFGVVGCQGKP